MQPPPDDLPAEDTRNVLAKGLDWAMNVSPEDCMVTVHALRAAHPDDTRRELAQRAISTRARRAAAQGFFTGLPSNPFVAAPAAVADLLSTLALYGRLSAEVGLISNDDYFSRPDWKEDALLLFAGRVAVSQAMKDAALAGAQVATKEKLKGHLTDAALKTLKKSVLTYFGKKLTQRGLINLVPVLGGVVGGAWSHREASLFGRRLLAWHFDGVLR
jgi:hypothetical protein